MKKGFKIKIYASNSLECTTGNILVLNTNGLSRDTKVN